MSNALTAPRGLLAASLVLLATTPARAAGVFELPLANPAFAAGVDRQGIPLGWSKYGGGPARELSILTAPDGARALCIAHGDPASEVGVVQSVPLPGGQTYQAAVKVRAVPGTSTAGAYLQLRFLPSNQFVQTSLAARSAEAFSEVSLKGTAPPGTSRGMIYLYAHRGPTPSVLIREVRLRGGLPPPPPPPPPPVPPQYGKLKNLYLDTALVQGGRPRVTLVVPASGAYRAAAAAIQAAIRQRSGATVPVVSDDSPQAAVPIQGNLIVLGNRSTNASMRALYDLYYCLVDLKYPGPAGYVIRSVHNPFGDGRSVIVVGGSDAEGVDAGARALAEILARRPATPGEMSIGWTMATKLGRGVKRPTDIKDFQTWEASQGYGSIGYFGWSSISKRMAMYYMTGDEFSAREVVRLAFPDRQALRDIEEIDGERIENKHDPLAGFYHYNAHMAILFWDLIEESPLFTDAERLKITNAFARQLNHRKGEGVYQLTEPPALVSSRHGQWAAISLYCLGRYFHKDYPEPVWTQCQRAGALAFQSLHQQAWVAGESDNLFWYSTGIAPVLTYMVLTGDRKPLENGVLAELLRGQEILSSGRVPDWALRSASLGFLNKAAYLTGDGRWITYRRRTQVDTDVFRLGQSFWPDDSLQPKVPEDMVGKWNIFRLSEPAWESRASGLPSDQSFYFGSYRSAADAGGDYILLKGFNGASRNPYHTFDILELRLGGQTILQGFQNQVTVSADGMVEPAVAMDAALLTSGVVGPTATAVGEVPRAAFCNWRRTICQRTGRYAIVVDDLTFRADSQNMKVSTTWQVTAGGWDPQRKAVRVPATAAAGTGWVELRSCDDQETHGRGVVTMNWNGAVRKNEHRSAFYLIAPAGPGSPGPLACTRVGDNAARLELPERAIAVVNKDGDLTVFGQDHLYGHSLRNAFPDVPVATSDVPVDLDWDFAHGVANVVASKPAQLRLNLRKGDKPRLDGAPAGRLMDAIAGVNYIVELSAGRHVLTAAWPADQVGKGLTDALSLLSAIQPKPQSPAPAAGAPRPAAKVAELSVALARQVGGKVADMIRIPSADGELLCVAEGRTIHLLSHDGQEVRTLSTDGKIRVLRWWDEYHLLLAGCTDEKVIAFDADGRRRWVFTSEMDPAVYEAAKNYWFKSAPGHEGIHGLYSGPFDAGNSRCFVGSACTLEILDAGGKLVKRTPVFWGPVWKFLLVPSPHGGQDLLMAQWPNGSDDLAIANSRTMAVTGRGGYYSVPVGHSYVGGWTAQNRTALFYEDLQGDGRKQVATAINGTWNRVSVYSEEGKPLYNAQFGPGTSSAPRAQMRDMDLADLFGDGRKELVVGISEGLVVALSNHCEKLWATRLPSPPVSLRAIRPRGAKLPWVVAGCEDGTVAVLDAHGVLIRLGRLSGRPWHIETLLTPGGPLAVLATDRGEVKGFKIGD